MTRPNHAHMYSDQRESSVIVIWTKHVFKLDIDDDCDGGQAKAITRPILEYASTIWSPIASTTGITKLQTIQNMALRIATGCTSDTNIQHLHNETNILPLNTHLKLHSSQLRQKSQHPTHPLHKFTVLTENERHKKQTIFDNNNNYTVNINTKSDLICEDLIQSNLKLIHSHIVSNHLSQRPPNKVLQDQTPSVSPAELLLSRETRRTLAQLRTNKSPLLVSYLFSIGDPRHPSPLCPLCLMHDHTSSHLFECKSLPTSLSSLDLWSNPDKVEPFLATWGERLLAATWFRVLDSAGSTLVEWGRQQQQQQQLWWGTPDIIWNRVPDRRRSKRKSITKCWLTVCRSIEKRHGVWAGASDGFFCSMSATYDGAVLLWQW